MMNLGYCEIACSNQTGLPVVLTGLELRKLPAFPFHRVSPFTGGVIFTRARVSLALPSVRKSGDYS